MLRVEWRDAVAASAQSTIDLCRAANSHDFMTDMCETHVLIGESLYRLELELRSTQFPAYSLAVFACSQFRC